MAYRGFFKPQNPTKYIGNPIKIMYRSLWERKFMKFCDSSGNIIRWGSEEVVVPYMNPLDRKQHRYYVDFIVEMKTAEGIKTLLIEIKPKKQCVEPKRKKKVTRGYISEVQTWITNTAKWAAASEVSKNRGWEFKILTEDDLFRKTK